MNVDPRRTIVLPVSQPFEAPSTGKIAVKVVDCDGDEVPRVYEAGAGAKDSR